MSYLEELANRRLARDLGNRAKFYFTLHGKEFAQEMTEIVFVISCGRKIVKGTLDVVFNGDTHHGITTRPECPEGVKMALREALNEECHAELIRRNEAETMAHLEEVLGGIEEAN